MKGIHLDMLVVIIILIIAILIVLISASGFIIDTTKFSPV